MTSPSRLSSAASVPQPLTRRAAIKHGLAGIVATGFAPLFLPSRLFGASAPSNRITVGFVGNGLIATQHVGTLLGRDDCQIIALCDVWRSKAEKMKQRIEQGYANNAGAGSFKGVALHSIHEELVARPDLDVVFATTPDHWHAAVAIAAMQAGKDVYCEKPMTLTVREGRTMVQVARRTGRVLQTGTQQRSEASFRRAATIIRNGWIGDLKLIRTKLGRFPAEPVLPEEPVPADFNYDRWLGPTPWRPFNQQRVKGDYGGGWRIFLEYGSRKNGDWGAHHFDIIQWALGMDDSGPVEFIPAGFEGSPYQTHRYANGVTVQRVDGNQPAMIEFIGTKGTVGVGRDNYLVCDPPGLATRPVRANEAHVYESTNHHTDFFTCVRTRQRPIADVEVGHRSATVGHLCGIARQLRRPLRWDPVREEIIDDPVASRLLDRPRRAPYVLI
ncbi:MAG TPA: Gfo/Idh/MocA family oxidoreductase [Lacunisphaera sp.]|nr:Gfo/Idh/MocA family oxidoreductase [Lacunisphaera sp.]